MITLTDDEAIDLLQVISKIDGFLIASSMLNRDIIFEDLERLSVMLSAKLTDSRG